MTSPPLSMTQLRKVQGPALIVGAVASALCLLGAAFATDQAFQSFLTAYLFWWGIGIGALGLLVLNHLVGGNWGLRTRPIFSAVIATMPLLAIGFLPIALGMRHLYIWTDAAVVEADPLLQAKQFYLRPSLFLSRAVLYFVVWCGLAWLFLRTPRGVGLRRRQFRGGGVAGVSLILIVLTTSFAAIDWAMSLEPHWYSTIYGGLIAVGGAVTALAIVTAVVAMGGAGPIEEEANVDVLHDLGSLLLAFLMLWAYFAFSQFLIIWSGNLPDEIRWYLHRLEGGWEWLALMIVVFHFFVPFMLLISRHRKRNPAVMLVIVAIILGVHYIDVFWNVAPAFSKSSFRIHWLDLVAPFSLGGLWIAAFVWQLGRRIEDGDELTVEEVTT